jgi:hypothetical protein
LKTEKIAVPWITGTSVVLTLTGFVEPGEEYRIKRDGKKIVITPVKSRLPYADEGQ